MNIYDEAIKELQEVIGEYGMDYYTDKHFPITIKALERAKKVEELNKLLNKKCYLLVDIMNNYNGLQDNFIQLLGEIDELEKELGEIK